MAWVYFAVPTCTGAFAVVLCVRVGVRERGSRVCERVGAHEDSQVKSKYICCILLGACRGNRDC